MGKISRFFCLNNYGSKNFMKKNCQITELKHCLIKKFHLGNQISLVYILCNFIRKYREALAFNHIINTFIFLN